MGGGNSLPSLSDSQTFVVHVGQHLEYVPYKIRKNHPLQLLNLQRNQIKALPLGLENLKTLFLTDNGITGLSDDMQKALDSYVSLESLDISKNRIEELHIRNKQLNTLFVNRNILKHLPELLNISQIDASNNLIEEILVGSDKLQRLQMRQNLLKTIKPTIVFKNIQTIELQMNHLEVIPDLSKIFPMMSVANLSMNRIRKIEGSLPKTLQDLNVGYNELTELPELPESLIYLTISSNHIKHLPKLPANIQKIACDLNEIETVEETELKSLDYANFKHNKLEKMPNFGKLESMQCFIFKGNNIKEINMNYVCLAGEQYELSFNHLTFIQPEIFTTNIRQLFLEFNELDSLPHEIVNSNIKDIYLAHNKFREVPALPHSAETVSMSFNELTEADLSEYPLITTVHLSNNKLEKFVSPPKLANAYLSCNNIKEFPTFPSSIKSIDLSFNQMTELVNCNIPELRRLDISYNKIVSISPMKMARIEIIKIAGNPLQSGVDLSGFSILDTFDSVGVSGTKPSSAFREYLVSKENVTETTTKYAKIISLGEGRAGYAESQGVRPEMEDSLIVSYDDGLFAVFDGHGGAQSSTFSSHFLSLKLKEYGEEKINEAIKALNASIVNKKWEDGTTVALAQFNSDRTKFTIAYAGDTRALIIKKDGSLRYATFDHKPTNHNEVDRLTEVGGVITQGRIGSVLAVSRAIGDATIFGVSHECECKEFDVLSDDKYIVLACDGVFDVMTNEQVAEQAAACDDPMQAAYTIRNTALSITSMDNISVVVVKLN